MISTALMRIESKRRALGISSATISRLVGLRSSALSDGLREVSRLSGEQEARIEEVLTQLTTLDAACKPFRLPLDARGVADLQVILESGISSERLGEAIKDLFQQ